MYVYYRKPEPLKTSFFCTDVYHLLFNPPRSENVAGRLVEEEGGIQANLHAPLELYHRHNNSLLSSYSSVHKTFNADQPIDDLVSQGNST